MPRAPLLKEAPELAYRYDGSFEGFLCCVFESYTAHELPGAILGPDDAEASLFGVKEIVTDEERADRVARSVPTRISAGTDRLLRYAFLTCLPEKELVMLRFLRKGYRYGPRFLSFAGDEDVRRITEAVRRMLNEAHLLRGFIRFSEQSGVLVSTIGPKNFVLPFLARHFSERFPEERMLIYDENHHAALVYRPYESAVIPMDGFRAAPPDAGEREFRSLWRAFYDAVEIRPRHNERCRMTLMPKRYWRYMTEFTEDAPAEPLDRAAHVSSIESSDR